MLLRQYILLAAAFVGMANICALADAPSSNAAARPNFLFIAIDDLNNFNGYSAKEPGNFLQIIYPDPKIRAQVVARLTPNLDRLARQSAPFVRAFCHSALCGPSRTSLLTGVPAHVSGYYLHDRHFRLYPTLADAVTLPQHLKANGYFTTGLGKIFHTSRGNATGPLKDDWADVRHSWSQWTNAPGGCNGGEPSRFSPPDGGLMSFGPSRLETQEAGDYVAADFAARLLAEGTATLRTRASGGRKQAGTDANAQTVTLPQDQPFFLACGIFRPHLPFHAPRKFFDLFPVAEMTGLNRASLNGIIADLKDLPPGAQRFTDFTKGKFHDVMAHARQLDGEAGEIAAWRELVQAYLACIAFADTCLGRILEGYEQSPQRDNTIVVLWSDHGFHVGSKYHIAKQALWEEANNTVLLIRDPRHPSGHDGTVRRQMVSLTDLYPTIAALAGTPAPKIQIGADLTTVLRDAAAPEVHEALLMTYLEGNHSIRTPTHRFMRYQDGTTELYDLVKDPFQIRNLSGRPELADLEQKLATRLTAMTRGAVAAPKDPASGNQSNRDHDGQ
jgi:arylsulfatase A-like enzyme